MMIEFSDDSDLSSKGEIRMFVELKVKTVKSQVELYKSRLHSKAVAQMVRCHFLTFFESQSNIESMKEHF